jgi:hypothetical protein
VTEDYDDEDVIQEDRESLYISAVWMLGLMVDNLMWSLMTSGLQDSKECATMMEQMQDMRLFIDVALVMSEVTEDTVFH